MDSKQVEKLLEQHLSYIDLYRATINNYFQYVSMCNALWRKKDD